MRKPHPRYLTFEERKLIEKYIKQGLSCSETGRRINRSKTCIVTEIRKGGGKLYSAKIAQELSDLIRKNKYKDLSEMNKGIAPKHTDYKNRIDLLEMQIEILHDAIKELMKK